MLWNHRKFARCPISADQSGLLLIGRQSIKCRLLEVSLNGFGVLIDTKLADHHDQTLKLQVGGLVYIVRETRREVTRDGILLALEQIEEIVPNISMVPATRLGKTLTAVAWVAAACIALTAIYCVTRGHAVASLSFNW